MEGILGKNQVDPWWASNNIATTGLAAYESRKNMVAQSEERNVAHRHDDGREQQMRSVLFKAAAAGN